MIANTRPGADDQEIIDATGRRMTIPGCWAHLASIDRAIADGPSRTLGDARWSLFTLLPALAAAEWTRRFARRPTHRTLGLLTLTLALLFASVFILIQSRILVYPALPIASVWIASLATWLLLRLRPPAWAHEPGRH